MATLGSFGVRHEPAPEIDSEPLTFDWFGVEIRLAETYNQVRLVNLMEAARAVDSEDPTALVIVKDMLRLFIHGADFATFWKVAETEDQTLEDLSATMQGLMAALTDRPTQPLPDSLAGQQPTTTNLPAVSPMQESRGRPDLQLLLDESDPRSRPRA